MRLLYACLACLLTVFSLPASAQERFSIPLPTDAFPNFVSLGIGAAPDYLGSNDYFVGAAPAINLDLGPARFKMLGNWAMLDVLNDANWTLGPAAILRFGRTDVDDAVVSQLGNIDNTIELGVSFGYEFIAEDNPFKRLAIGVDLVHDVGGVHDDFVINAFARGIYPLPWRGGAAALALGMTVVGDDYADTYFSVSPGQAALTGLSSFSATGGDRDLRGGIGLFQSLSKNWHVGAGVLYGRMLGDAGSSPIVSDRGSRNQFIFGLGVAYTWGGLLDSM